MRGFKYIEEYKIASCNWSISFGPFMPDDPKDKFMVWLNGCAICDYVDKVQEAREILFGKVKEELNRKITHHETMLEFFNKEKQKLGENDSFLLAKFLVDKN